jgi:hypothetical protein
MRYLLRNLETGAFFKTQTDWTPNASEAIDFGDRDRAIRIALELPHKDLELVITRENGSIVLGARISKEDFI